MLGPLLLMVWGMNPIPPLGSMPPWEAAPFIKEWALAHQLMDYRETRYLFARKEEFLVDWRILLMRRADLKKAPKIEDCLGFPDRDMCNAAICFNRSYYENLCVLQKIDTARWWEYERARSETVQLYQIWDSLRDAQCSYYYVTIRRNGLARVRAAIGEEDYAAGRMPPPAPVWRFQRIR